MNNTRVDELKQQKREHQNKVTELNTWLLSHFDHPDRAKVFTDKAWHECEINRIDQKLRNIASNIPELGYGESLPIQVNNELINKSTR